MVKFTSCVCAIHRKTDVHAKLNAMEFFKDVAADMFVLTDRSLLSQVAAFTVPQKVKNSSARNYNG